MSLPKDWHITCTTNHWSTNATMIDLIIIHYVNKKCKELKLGPEDNDARFSGDADTIDGNSVTYFCSKQA